MRALTKPHPNLLKQYAIQSLLGTLLAPFVFVPLYFRYHTLRFRFDEEGVGASWGILFRREIYLSYKRIQDIHVKRNLIERWLGLGTVEIQTAAGTAGADLALDGLEDYRAVRDYLYGRMRGHEQVATPASASVDAPAAESEAVELLRAIREELAAARRALEERRG